MRATAGHLRRLCPASCDYRIGGLWVFAVSRLPATCDRESELQHPPEETFVSSSLRPEIAVPVGHGVECGVSMLFAFVCKMFHILQSVSERKAEQPCQPHEPLALDCCAHAETQTTCHSNLMSLLPTSASFPKACQIARQLAQASCQGKCERHAGPERMRPVWGERPLFMGALAAETKRNDLSLHGLVLCRAQRKATDSATRGPGPWLEAEMPEKSPQSSVRSRHINLPCRSLGSTPSRIGFFPAVCHIGHQIAQAWQTQCTFGAFVACA